MPGQVRKGYKVLKAIKENIYFCRSQCTKKRSKLSKAELGKSDPEAKSIGISSLGLRKETYFSHKFYFFKYLLGL